MIILKHIEMTLDPDSITRAIHEVELFESRLEPAMTHLIDRLAEKGVEIARAELIFFDDPAYRTGALSESIRYESKDGEAVITAGEGLHNAMGDADSPNYAMYVEYGTGYTKPNGWFYPAPWGKYVGKGGKRYAWTMGMPPRPFMTNTFHGLEEEVQAAGGRIIAEYLKE